MHRRFWGLLVAATVLSPVAPARATVPVVIIDGYGWGHGVGLAQDGAFWMAKAGATAPQILGQFYPGTSLGKVSGGSVRVAVFDDPSVTVAFPDGGRIDERADGPSSTGLPIRVDPGGRVRLRTTGDRLVVTPVTGAQPTTTTPPPTTTTTRVSPPPTASPNVVARPKLLPTTTTSTTAPRQHQPTGGASAPALITTSGPLALTPVNGGSVTVVDRQRTYRGSIEASARDAAVRLVNQLSIEQYLRGMGEVRDPSWPAAALGSQAIAARTYALRAMDKAGEICDTARCQVYLGQQAEYAAMDKAVAATTGQVLVFNKALASAVYSANAGGHSASREEGFGVAGDGYPYLRPAPYETKDAMPWTVSIALSDLAARLGHAPVTDVSVTGAGPSGRALAVALSGPTGTRSVSGLGFARALGLHSTRFTVRMGVADTAPAPPSAGTVLQAPPDEVGLTPDTPNELHALAIDLPDRPRVERATSATHGGPVSTVRALALLALALGVVVGTGYRRRPQQS